MVMATGVTIRTNPQVEPSAGAARNPPAARDRLVMQNVTSEVTLQGTNGNLVRFIVHIRGNRGVEHNLPTDVRERNALLARIQAAAQAALTPEQVDQTQSVRMNFSRARRRDGSEGPRFNFTRITRRATNGLGELPIETRANGAFLGTLGGDTGLSALLTRHENRHLESLRNNPGQPQPGNAQLPAPARNELPAPAPEQPKRPARGRSRSPKPDPRAPQPGRGAAAPANRPPRSSEAAAADAWFNQGVGLGSLGLDYPPVSENSNDLP